MSSPGSNGRGDLPYLSVVVPAHDAARMLPDTLGALRRSDLDPDRWELIVVDDGSEDDTPLVAASFADTVIRLPAPAHGPAYARNRGFEAARGDCVVFVDADVRVHADALPKIAATFRDHSDVGAVFGSYDADPAAPGVVSRFRNLMHHHVHQENAGEAETFWAGCGAVRAEVFREAGMYDEWHYAQPQIEDIELGRRIRRLGHRILLRPDIQGTHLKRWTLTGMLQTDFLRRGVPWTRLLIQEGTGPATRALNLRASEKMATACVAGGSAAAGGALLTGTSWPLGIAAAALLVVLLCNVRFYGRLARVQGVWFPVATLPLHLLYYLSNCVSAVTGWLAHHVVGKPMPDLTTQGYHEARVQTWPPVPSPPGRSIWADGSLPRPDADDRTTTAGAAAAGATAAAAGPHQRWDDDEDGKPTLTEPALAFLPIHKRAFGIATGTASALVFFTATAHHLLLRPSVPLHLQLFAEYFYGYTVSWSGAFVGAGWAFFTGFVGGWFLAFSRNLVLAALVFGRRARDDLGRFRGFLDHL